MRGHRATYWTLEAAKAALTVAACDTAGDFGDEAVQAAWPDLVRAIAGECPPGVAADLLRINGVQP